MVSPVLYHNFFATLTSVHHYNTRQACKGDIFMTQENTLQYGLRSVRYAGAKSWNKIPCVIKQTTTVRNFCWKIASVLHQLPTIESFLTSSQDYEDVPIGCSVWGCGIMRMAGGQSAIFFSEGAEVVWQLFSLVLWLPPGKPVV